MTTKEPTYEELKERLANVEAELSALRARHVELLRIRAIETQRDVLVALADK